jgi:YD repeat-containing protein
VNRRRFAFALSTTVYFLTWMSARTLFAQYHANQDRGFAPDKLYSYFDLDNINSFNGNLVITLPIGQSYPVNGLSYGITAVYNSNVWDLLLPSTYTTTIPNRHSNAGMGWQVTLGRLIPPTDPTNETRFDIPTTTASWVYESPDGAVHILYSTDSGATGYSADSTRIRMQTVGPQRVVDLPDGRILTFSDFSTNGTDWRLVQIADRFSNTVAVSYPTVAEYAETWQLADSQGRTQTLYFLDASGTSYPQRILDHVALTSFGAVTATYQFNYAYRSIARGPQDASNNGNPGPNITVALLKGITMPDSTGAANGAQFSILNPTADPASSDPDPYYDVSGVTSGMIRGLRLPTLGWIEWDYALTSFPAASDSTRKHTATYGVTQRRLLDASHTTIGAWDYNHIFAQATTCQITDPNVCPHPTSPCLSGGPRQMATLITGPARDAAGARDTTLNYFSVFVSAGDECTNTQSWDDSEYSSPFTRFVQDSGGRFLSIERRTGIDPSNLTGGNAKGAIPLGTLVRSEYVTYDSDTGANFPRPWDSNRREKRHRISYDDDSNCSGVCDSTVDRYSFDNFGHFRQESHGGTFTGGTYRTTFTNYDGTLDTSQDWVLGMYAEQCVADESSLRATALTACSDLTNPAVSKTNFERGTGFLSAKRMLVGSALGATDLLAVFSHDANGNVTKEQYYGGDSPSQALSLTSAFAPLATPNYEIDHTYTFNSNGALTNHQSQYSGMTFFTADEDYDASTGFVKATRDTARLQTNLEYDPRGRIVWTKPQAVSGITRGAWTNYVYSDATTTASAEADALQYSNGTTSGTPLTKKQYFFDAVGRLSKQKNLMVDGSLSTRVTTYSALGTTLTTSQLEGTDPPTLSPTTFTYDPFSRPSTITASDGKMTSFSYLGQRQKTRSVTIATASSGAEASAVTTEVYDTLGRLVKVTEPSGATSAGSPTGANVTTQYGYDVGNRLGSVTMTGSEGAQTRTFTYDNRGFLLSEKHPEKGISGNGTVSYSSYDARGHAGQKIDGAANGQFDLTFTYDAAERLTEVDDLFPSTTTRRALKKFVFGTANTATPSYENGKLTQTQRVNHPQSVPADVVVTETYTYGGKDGRVSKKSTQATNSGTSSVIQSFSQTFAYDDLGEATSLGYPTCVTHTCSGSSPISTITNTFTNGFLQSVASYATSITYNANGMVKDVVHGVNAGANVTDTYAIDATNGMVRPSTITFTGYQDCNAPATPTITAPGSVCANASAQGSIAAQTGVTYSWSISGGTITAGGGTNAITFTAGASGTVTLNVTVSNACGNASASPATVAISVPTATVSGGGTIDAGGSSMIQAALTGTAPWSLTWSDGVVQSNVNASPATRTVSPSATTTYTVSSISDASCSGTASGSATVTIRPPTPTGLVATATSTSQVGMTWSPVAGADHYEVIRSSNNSAYVTVATPTGASYSDPGLAANNTYLYRVRAMTAGGVASNYSAMDPATTVMFTDDPLIARTTPVKAQHINELRVAVNAFRASAGFMPATFTDPALAPGSVIKAVHLTELRSALDPARASLSLPAVGYIDPVVTPQVTTIKKTHIDEVRGGVR